MFRQQPWNLVISMDSGFLPITLFQNTSSYYLSIGKVFHVKLQFGNANNAAGFLPI